MSGPDRLSRDINREAMHIQNQISELAQRYESQEKVKTYRQNTITTLKPKGLLSNVGKKIALLFYETFILPKNEKKIQEIKNNLLNIVQYNTGTIQRMCKEYEVLLDTEPKPKDFEKRLNELHGAYDRHQSLFQTLNSGKRIFLTGNLNVTAMETVIEDLKGYRRGYRPLRNSDPPNLKELDQGALMQQTQSVKKQPVEKKQRFEKGEIFQNNKRTTSIDIGLKANPSEIPVILEKIDQHKASDLDMEKLLQPHMLKELAKTNILGKLIPLLSSETETEDMKVGIAKVIDGIANLKGPTKRYEKIE